MHGGVLLLQIHFHLAVLAFVLLCAQGGGEGGNEARHWGSQFQYPLSFFLIFLAGYFAFMVVWSG